MLFPLQNYLIEGLALEGASLQSLVNVVSSLEKYLIEGLALEEVSIQALDNLIHLSKIIVEELTFEGVDLQLV